jgi:predicted GIY-YIG superfamily endonuclease
MWYVYILKSLGSKFIYIGSTNDLERRLDKHNKHLVLSTKAYAPYKIIAYVAAESQAQALSLEKYFKTGSGKAILYKRILLTNPLANETSA